MGNNWRSNGVYNENGNRMSNENDIDDDKIFIRGKGKVNESIEKDHNSSSSES